MAAACKILAKKKAVAKHPVKAIVPFGSAVRRAAGTSPGKKKAGGDEFDGKLFTPDDAEFVAWHPNPISTKVHACRKFVLAQGRKLDGHVLKEY